MQANHTPLSIIRRLTAISLGVLLVSGCSIKNDVPDFKYPSRTNYSDQNWPELAQTEGLIQAGEAANTDVQTAQAETDRIAGRAARLRERAAALRRASAN